MADPVRGETSYMKVAIERPFDETLEDIRAMVVPQSHIDAIFEQERRDHRFDLGLLLELRLTGAEKVDLLSLHVHSVIRGKPSELACRRGHPD